MRAARRVMIIRLILGVAVSVTATFAVIIWPNLAKLNIARTYAQGTSALRTRRLPPAKSRAIGPRTLYTDQWLILRDSFGPDWPPSTAKRSALEQPIRRN